MVYLIFCFLCLLASAGGSVRGGTPFSTQLTTCLGSFTVVVLEYSQIRSSYSTSGGVPAIVLETFSLIGDVCATVVVIFRVFQVGQATNQSASQTCWEIYCGPIVNVIEDCAVYPIIALSVFRAYCLYYGGQNVVGGPKQKFANTFRLQSTTFSSTSYTKVSWIHLSRLAPV